MKSAVVSALVVLFFYSPAHAAGSSSGNCDQLMKALFAAEKAESKACAQSEESSECQAAYAVTDKAQAAAVAGGCAGND